MDLAALRVFLAVASARSFSKAAKTLHRTQPAVSQAVRRLESELGERLFDRTSKDGRLTSAGRVLRDYADRLMRLAEEAESAIYELRDLRRGRVLIGANEAGVHALLPVFVKFRQAHPNIHLDVRRVPTRVVGAEVAQGSLDFGLLTFHPSERELGSFVIDHDELVLLTHPEHPLARRRTVTPVEVGREPIVAHNDPSPAREQVLRSFERRHETLNIQISLPSLDGIKRAVEMKLGVALLPRRVAVTEIARGQLVAIRVPQMRRPRQVRLVFRRSGQLSHAASAFLEVVKSVATDETSDERQVRGEKDESAKPRT